MTASANKSNSINSIDRLSIAYSSENIPAAYISNYSNPFKPYFYYIDSFGIGSIAEIAIYLLKDFTLGEINEIRQLLAKEVFKYAQYKLTDLKRINPALTQKEFTNHIDILVNYLDANKEQQTYLLSSKKIVKPLHLYAVLSLKFIQRVLKKLEFNKYKDPIRLLLGSETPPLTHYDYSDIAKQLINAMGCLTNGVSIHANIYRSELTNNQQKQRQTIEKRMVGLQTTIKANKQKQQAIIELATKIWKLDNKQQLLRTGDIVELISEILFYKYQDTESVPTRLTIKKWIKPTCPDYAKRTGRKSQQDEINTDIQKKQIIEKLSAKSTK
ncbi:hypothetical protein [Entomomonas asaccharolytica]|uniref:Uncharacterized protein n=1 Tax=Entomomonas asaccharolytica TaxID=2785331 RepID=A0A974NFE1_9GAMM|nr:hypothetical protein [Entomomonas asaccharolytica]QQP85538.1 hypothetical protein JHT90_14385 [Entomomonas asaccharolytica]